MSMEDWQPGGADRVATLNVSLYSILTIPSVKAQAKAMVNYF